MMGTVSGAMRSMRSMIVVLLAAAPAHAEPPRIEPAPKAAPDAAPKAAPDAAPKAAPDTAPKAAPAPGQPKVLPPASLQDVMPKAPKPTDHGTGAPAFGGGFAAGTVIKPPAHPDARPWPEGMIMTPPDVKDPMAIVPGTDGLPPGERRAPPDWGKRLTAAVDDGIGAIVQLMLPSPM